MNAWRCFSPPPLDDPPQEIEIKCPTCPAVIVFINPTAATLSDPRCSSCLRQQEEIDRLIENSNRKIFGLKPAKEKRP